MSVLAVIPARAGSKGLPNKNILNCAGKPLIAWSIEAALKADRVSRVVVSTDSCKIAEIAEQFGAWVPFLRSTDISTDEANVVDVVRNAIMEVSKQGENYDDVILLQPTSPVRNARHIDEAIKYFNECKKTNRDTLISLRKMENKLRWLMDVDTESGYLNSLTGLDMENPRRQQLAPCFFPNGAIYLAPCHDFNGFYGTSTIPYIMDDDSSVDIDELTDLEKAQTLLEARQLSPVQPLR